MRIDETNVKGHQEGFIDNFGGFYVRRMEYPAGQRHSGHSHFIDHIGNLVVGQARVHWRDPDGTTGVIEMLVPSKIHMPAERWHELEFISDCVWECWFAKAEADRLYGHDPEIFPKDWTEENYVEVIQ